MMQSCGACTFTLSALSRVRIRWFACLVIAAAWLVAAQAQAAVQIVLPATADTFTAKSAPDKNYNAASYVRVRATGEKQGFLRFDPTPLSGTVVSAVLDLNVLSVTAAGQIEIHEILGSWNESTVTYNTRPPIASQVVATVPVSPSDVGHAIEVSIVSTVQKWKTAPSSAYGLALVGSAGVDVQFRVREKGTGASVRVSQSGGGPAPGDGPDLLYFSTLNNSTIPGVSGPYDDADIYRFDASGQKYDRVFDARNAGLPSNADIDALYVVDPMTFYMSFDRDDGTNVPGLGLAMDEDVVIYRAGTFSWFFHGADIGLGDGPGEDIDGLHVLSNSTVLISTAGAPSVPGVAGAGAEDILRCDGSFGAVSHCNWTMYFKGSDSKLANTARENVNALFESGNDLYFSTHGNFSIPGLSGDKNDIAHCEHTQNGTCASFSKFFDGPGLADDIDAAHFATNAFADTDPALFRVVVLGSSTAAGTGASSPAKSWVGLLTTWLTTATTRSRVFNLSKSGLTTEPFRPQDATPNSDPNKNITRVLEINPDVIIINLPTNNVAADIPITTTISHYAEMFAAADKAGIPVFVMTSQPRNFEDAARRMQLQDEAIAIRTRFGARVIDTYNELADFNNGLRIKSKYDSGDGTHVNDAGHAYLFETTRMSIAPYVTP